jgi:hypothetical protein
MSPKAAGRCLAGASQWQPGPVHVHDPDGQLVNEHVAPCAHAISHPPAEQLTLHVAPLGHDVLHLPEEQETLHVPPPQYVKQ